VDVALHPPAAFFRNYVLRRGFMDGTPGFIISAMNAHYVFLKFAKLWAKGK
jgi:(heptosyl)LPS beta-1,4-glucosyltransferase